MYPVKTRRCKPWLIILAPLAAALLIAAGLLFGLNRFELVLTIHGEQEMVLDYDSEYEESGAEVMLRGTYLLPEGRSLNLKIKTKGTPPPHTVGNYQITYSAGLLWMRAEAVRNVSIVDRISPEISLESDQEHITPVGQPYEEEGFSAWDAYDGDLTDKVERYESEGTVYYSVTDSSGNRTEVTRQIHYQDITPPEILLEGGEELRIRLGTLFCDPGFTAVDDQDGNVTELVNVSGEVNHRETGSYTLTYTVTDESGNEAVVTRNVIVQKAAPPQQVIPEGKTIYLTFDDGPGIYTEQLLAVLEKYDVKATFFVIGNNPELMKKIVDGGHSIGIHTVSHNYRGIYESEEAFFSELYQMQDSIYEATGTWTTLMRFPGGSSNTVSSFNKGIMSRLTILVQEHGFQYFDWNVDSDDAGRARTSDEVYSNVISGVRGMRASVVLQHDIKDYSVEAVERIIRWGLENGYTFQGLQPDSPGCHHGVNN